MITITQSSPLVATACSYLQAGLSVLPVGADKKPVGSWKALQTTPLTPAQAQTRFAYAAGIGIICGQISGNLELLDFDDKGSRFAPWRDKVAPALFARLVVEKSPSGGRHVFYRIGEEAKVEGNRKLAMTADKKQVLIETRGERGYVKCAPSAGYTLEQGDLTHVPTLTCTEAQSLIDAATSLDEREKVKVLCPPTLSTYSLSTPSPIDDYNAHADLAALLTRHGWKHTGDSATDEYWERPGKDERSTSASWNGTVFYVFSSNADPFEPNKGYNKFQVLATLEFGGDQKAAFRAIRNQGYGLVANATNRSDLFVANATPVLEQPQVLDPGPLPEALLHAPGFIDKLMAYTLSTAPYPNKVLAFAGALSMLAHLSGRAYRDPRDLRTNLYCLALADSGVGKDHPRQVNMRLANAVAIFPSMADRFASAEGLEDALLQHPASFFQVDEIDTLFAALKDKKDTANEKIFGSVLQFATSATSVFTMRKKALKELTGRAGRFEVLRANGIDQPHLVIFGTAVPKYFYQALSERAMENGLLARCLIFEAGERGKAGTPHAEPFPDDLKSMAETFASENGYFLGPDMERMEGTTSPLKPIRTVPETPEAQARHAEIVAECDGFYHATQETADRALWNRAVEKASKLALLYAISENPLNPQITREAVDWGWAIVKHLTRQMLYKASLFVFENEFDELRQKVTRYLTTYGGERRTLKHGMLLRYMHVDGDTFRRVIETMIETGAVMPSDITSGGKAYTLIG